MKSVKQTTETLNSVAGSFIHMTGNMGCPNALQIWQIYRHKY